MTGYAFRPECLFLLVVLLIADPFISQASSQEPDDIVQETLKILLEGGSWHDPTQRRYEGALRRARSDAELRAALVEILVERLEAKFESKRQWGEKNGQEVDVLRKLDGRVALPLIKGWWDRPDRNSVHEYTEELQLQMLNALSEWLPDDEQVPFLIDVQLDIPERPRLRLEAILLLCRNGSEEAVNHVIENFLYDQEQYDWREHGRIVDPPQEPDPWDRDSDNMSDYIEKGLLLDPSNPDTDGDSIVDGWDHNPLFYTKEALTQEQVMAMYLIYLHATYNVEFPGTFAFRTFILPEVARWKDGKPVENLLWGIEFIGVPAKFLHYTEKQCEAHQELVGYGAYELRLHFVKDLGPDRKEYSLFEFYGPLGGATYRIVVKRCQKVWLPVEWVITEQI